MMVRRRRHAGAAPALTAAVATSLAAAASAFSSAPAPPSTWPPSFSVAFNETVNNGRGNVSGANGRWYYDFANARARQERDDGSLDRFCAGESAARSPCVHLNPAGDANRYLVWPALGQCCLCGADADGFGVLRPDWVASSNGTYLGRLGLDTPTWSGPADAWHVIGLQSNYYYQTPGAVVPLAIAQGSDDFMFFDAATFAPGPQTDSLFDKPAYCSGAAKCKGLCSFEHAAAVARSADVAANPAPAIPAPAIAAATPAAAPQVAGSLRSVLSNPSMPPPTAGPAADITWAVAECCYPDGVAAGGVAHFEVTWGVDAHSVSPAAAAVLSGSFWYGGIVTNVSVGAPGNCTLVPATQQLVCELGAVAVGAFGPTVSFDVSVLSAETAPHYLPFFIAGLDGFDEGPETFGRAEVQ